MKYLPLYKKLVGCETPDDVFHYIIANLKPALIDWNYFVNWQKVLSHVRQVEMSLNTLNYLIGKDDFDSEFRYLVKQHPEVVKVIPLLAVRSGGEWSKFKILIDYSERKLIFEDFDFSKHHHTEFDIEKILIFVIKSGIKDLFTSKRLKNLVDYMVGVEAGLDSNGRKNRGGQQMEAIVEAFIANICRTHDISYISQASQSSIYEEFRIKVPVDKSARHFDFAIKTLDRLFLVETNFYGSSGSKLKATAGEYKDLKRMIGSDFVFIWITDGAGWLPSKKHLKEAFLEVDHLLSLNLLENGVLEELLTT